MLLRKWSRLGAVNLSIFLLLAVFLGVLFYKFIYVEQHALVQAQQRPILTEHAFTSAANAVIPSVISVQTIHDDKPQILGSGIVLDQNGHIVTNAHVISNQHPLLVRLADESTVSASVVGIDETTDLAVLKIDAPNLQACKIRDSNSLAVGEPVLAVGNPFGLRNTVTQGIISGVGSLHGDYATQEQYNELFANLIQTDTLIGPGNSGGALVDLNGNLIGIPTAYITGLLGNQGISFAIPSDTVQNVCNQLINNGKVTRGWIGAQLSLLPDQVRHKLLFPKPYGIYVQNTVRNGPAQTAGILPGDIITKINNTQVNDLAAGLRAINNLTPGETYNIEVFRNGDAILFPIKASLRTS